VFRVKASEDGIDIGLILEVEQAFCIWDEGSVTDFVMQLGAVFD
jgi:hypothetical protein